MKLSTIALVCLGLSISAKLSSQAPITSPVSVDSHMVLDAAGPEQRQSIGNIYLIACQQGQQLSVGTGFVIEGGVVITNSHVTATCDEKTLLGVTPTNKAISFKRVIKDDTRDLAILIPVLPLTGGFRLATSENVDPGTVVSTWGYPFAYNGVSPLLSVGYVSGYRSQLANGKMVKHVVVNGAFNHGNSGGPLLVSQHKEVIGIVVLTYLFYPPEIKQIIEALSNQRSGVIFGSRTMPDGTTQGISEAQITGMVLNEFYNKTQVMIGEAIGVSELHALLAEHQADLPASRVKSVAKK